MIALLLALLLLGPILPSPFPDQVIIPWETTRLSAVRSYRATGATLALVSETSMDGQVNAVLVGDTAIETRGHAFGGSVTLAPTADCWWLVMRDPVTRQGATMVSDACHRTYFPIAYIRGGS